MTRAGARLRLAALGLALAATGSACVSTTPPGAVAVRAPRFPNYPAPVVPDSLTVDPRVRTALDDAWRRLQAGDVRRARSGLVALLAQDPAFFPAEAALGFVELADRKPEAALGRFDAALGRNARYLPALEGRAEVLLAEGRDADAITAIEAALAVDPARETLQTRLELVRFRFVQSLIAAGREARAAGHTDQARQILEQALARSPSSDLILVELAGVERSAGSLERAEAYARRAVAVAPANADAHAVLAELLVARGRYAEAADAYERAVAIDPRDEWRQPIADLRARASVAGLPPEFAAVARAGALNRGQVAAFVGVRLEELLARAPARVADVATDVRRHWAAPWILQVTRAGVMPLYPNHTFQPAAGVSRGALAEVVADLVRLASGGRAADFARWQAARPRFSDLPVTHVTYRAAALAVAAGAMTAGTNGDFRPTQPATGADLEAAVRRIQALSSR